MTNTMFQNIARKVAPYAAVLALGCSDDALEGRVTDIVHVTRGLMEEESIVYSVVSNGDTVRVALDGWDNDAFSFGDSVRVRTGESLVRNTRTSYENGKKVERGWTAAEIIEYEVLR